MLDRFKYLDEPNEKAFEEFNNELKELLEQLDEGAVFQEGGYTQEEFTELLQSFVEGQRGSLGRTKEGSWSIAPNDQGMDSDIRVAYIFTPTYLVTAILSRVYIDYKNLASEIPNYLESLKKGLSFCSYRGLLGHGFDGEAGAAEALTILSIGKVPVLLEQDKKLCPELRRAIRRITKMMKNRLDNGTAYGVWGEDLQDAFSSALETVIIKNDIELYQIILQANKDSELVGEEKLPW